MPQAARRPRTAKPTPAAEPQAAPTDRITVGGFSFTIAELFPESGVNPASDHRRAVDERLAALEAQHIAMRDGRRPQR